MKHTAFSYYKWYCFYIPLWGWRAMYYPKPKAMPLNAGSKEELRQKIRKHYFNWGW